jgi:hypothetical protein
MKKVKERDGCARLEKEIRKPIRPQVNRPHGFAVPGDPEAINPEPINLEAIKRENALMEELHQKAIAEAQRDKLKLLCCRYSLTENDFRGLALNLAVEHEPRSLHGKLRLLCRRYSLAENDYEGLALNLAIQHEPGFRVVDRQITSLPLTMVPPCFWGPVRIKDGVLIIERTGRPVDWSPERLLLLLKAVQTEKKKSDVTKDLDALASLARKKAWAPPPTHRSKSTYGESGAWVRTLQSRLHDAKKFKRQLDCAERTLEQAKRRTRK